VAQLCNRPAAALAPCASRRSSRRPAAQQLGTQAQSTRCRAAWSTTLQAAQQFQVTRRPIVASRYIGVANPICPLCHLQAPTGGCAGQETSHQDHGSVAGLLLIGVSAISWLPLPYCV